MLDRSPHPQNQPLADIGSPPALFAKRVGVSKQTIYRAIKSGRLRTIRLGPKKQIVLHDQIGTLKSA
jgi:predicted site-specific integrase-resolvase